MDKENQFSALRRQPEQYASIKTKAAMELLCGGEIRRLLKDAKHDIALLVDMVKHPAVDADFEEVWRSAGDRMRPAQVEQDAAQIDVPSLQGPAHFWVALPDITDIPDDVLTEAGLQIKARQLSEQAEKEQQPSPDTEGWIPWPGGDMPVDGSCLVAVRLKNDKAVVEPPPLPAWRFKWNHVSGGTDIIAYKVVKP